MRSCWFTSLTKGLLLVFEIARHAAGVAAELFSFCLAIPVRTVVILAVFKHSCDAGGEFPSEIVAMPLVTRPSASPRSVSSGRQKKFQQT